MVLVMKKILMLLMAIILSISLSTLVFALPQMNINVKPVFYEGDVVKFSYSFFSETDELIRYTAGIRCDEEIPQDLQELKQLTLRPQEIIREDYIYGHVDDNVKSSECVAFVSILEPDSFIKEESFSIKTKDEFTVDVMTCKDSSCSDQVKVFTKSEDVFIDFSSDVAGVSVSATLTKPDGSTEQLTLPAKLEASMVSQIGTYELEITATKSGYKDFSSKEQFGVIENNAEVKFVGMCTANGLCEGEENYRNCPQDCFAEYIVKQEEESNRIYTFLTVVLLVLVFSILTYIEITRIKQKKGEDLELKNYILNVVTKGYSQAQIKAELEKSGWSDKTIDHVLGELKKYNLDDIRKRAILDRELKLKRYVFDMFNKGFSEAQVRKDLSTSGWPDKIVNVMIREVRIYFPKKGADNKKFKDKNFVALSELEKSSKTTKKPAKKVS